jgi:uncharacterized protein involved in exopolysaccharide biosynthesis
MNDVLRPFDGSSGSSNGDGIVDGIVLPLVRARRTVGVCLAVAVAVAFAIAAIEPNEYVSTGKMLVRFGEREQTTAENVMDPRPAGAPHSAREDLETEVHLFSNPEMFVRVARDVGPGEILRPYDPTKMDDAKTPALKRQLHRLQAWIFGTLLAAKHEDCPGADECDECLVRATETLRRRTQIFPEPRSNVISIAHVANDPGVAQRINQVVLERALDRHLEVYSTDPSFEFLRTRTEEAQTAAQDADRALALYRQECNVYDLESQRSELLSQIAALERETAVEALRLSELKARQTFLSESLGRQVPNERRVVDRAPIPNPERGWMQERINQMRIERADLLSKYPEGSPIVRARDQMIQEMQRELSELPALIDVGEALQDVANPAFDRLRARLEQVSEDIRGLEVLERNRSERLVELRARISTIQECEPQLARLTREQETRTQSATQLAAALERARSLQATDHLQYANVRLIQPATKPWDKSGPNRAQILGIGAAIGLAFGTALALVRKALERTLRRPEQVEGILGLPVVGIIPEVRGRRVRALERLRRAS